MSVRTFDVTMGATVRAHGITYDYFRARSCPRRAIYGVFDFKNWTTGQTATTTVDRKVRCTLG